MKKAEFEARILKSKYKTKGRYYIKYIITIPKWIFKKEKFDPNKPLKVVVMQE